MDAMSVKTLISSSVVACLAAALGWKLARMFDSSSSSSSSRAAAHVQQLQEALAHEQEKRAADRSGRIRAEQKLKQLNLQLVQLTALTQVSAVINAEATNSSDGHEKTSSSAQQRIAIYPFAPIGVLRSCFNDRRGTPRQPHLVPAARAALRLGPGVPSVCLRGLEGFSHCWVLYVFHENTDLAKLMAARASTATGSNGSSSAGSSQIKALISVPRLNGGRMGVLATRSPHRPVPIGLSTAQIVSVDAAAGVLVLGGVDIVDGSPVLDIKPYVPFCDALPDAVAPDWVTAAADQEPLALSSVTISPAAVQALTDAWAAVRHQSLCPSPEQLLILVQQVLSRDIRSLHQRRDIAPVAVPQQQPQQAHQQGSTGLTADTGGDKQQQQQEHRQQLQQQQGSGDEPVQAADTQQAAPQYTVTLDGVEVTYSITGSGHVMVVDAAVASHG